MIKTRYKYFFVPLWVGNHITFSGDIKISKETFYMFESFYIEYDNPYRFYKWPADEEKLKSGVWCDILDIGD